MTEQRTIAVIRADLERSDIGTRSRLTGEIGGMPILRRTVDRLSVVPDLAAIYVLCPAAQRDHCRRLLAGTPALIRDFAGAESPWRKLAAVARKWSLDGWRGGIGGATHFDEFLDPPLIDGLLQHDNAEAALCLSAAAPVFSADLASRMLRHRAGREDELRLVFTQALPGLGGVLLQRSLVAELVARNVPIGTLFAYKPDTPQRDLIFQACCVDLPAPLRFCTGRLVADTDRSMSLLDRLIREVPQPDLDTIGPWLHERNATETADFPLEVELELTTDDPYPCSRLRPRGDAILENSANPRPSSRDGSLLHADMGGLNRKIAQRRGPIELSLVEFIAAELATRDDALLVLGGFGDPLGHPQFAEILRTIRHQPESPFGLAVRTTAVNLTEPAISALIAARVDVLNVLIDAWTPETYAKVHGVTDHGLSPRAEMQTRKFNEVGASQAFAGYRGRIPPAASEHLRAGSADGWQGLESAGGGSRPQPDSATSRGEAAGLTSPPDLLAPILDRLARLSELRRTAGSLGPLVVPEFCKSLENIDELDAFFDGWIRRVGAANIAGYSHYAGRLPDRAVIDMRPPVRTPCRRLRSRCLILCDGTVALCDQDFHGEAAAGRIGQPPGHIGQPAGRVGQSVGRLGDSAGRVDQSASRVDHFAGRVGQPGGPSLAEIWNSAAMQRARDLHQQRQWDALPLCAGCHEWHRP